MSDPASDAALTTAWCLLSGILILFFQAGLLAYTTGNAMSKNVKSTLLRQLLDQTLGSVVFVLIGWGLYRGNNPFASGSDAQFYEDNANNALVFQQFGYCVTASALVAASLQGRCKLWVTTVSSMLVCGIFWPIQAHWAWDPNGYLHTLGFKDFGGSGVIHLFAGTCALLANWLCGPRVNRFGRGSRHAVELSAPMAFIAKKLGGGRRMYGLLHVLSGHIDLELVVREVPGHSPALAGLGTVVVAVAWIPLNCMNGMTTDITSGGALASKAAVNTLLAGNAAVMSAVLWSVLVRQENDVNLVARALMAGLVAVSGPCAYLSAWAAIVVGMFALCVLLACDTLVTRALKVDDPLSIVSVHAACGVLGLLWLGLADQTDGLFVSGDAHLLGVEMLGCLCIMACGVAAAAPFIVARAMLHDGIAYPQDEQLMGLDFIYFTGTAYPDLDLEFVGTAPPSRRASTADKKVGTDLVQALESSVHSVTGGFFKRPVSHAQSEGSVHGAPSVTPVASSTQLLPPKQPTNFANDALDVILADDLLRKRLRQFLSANHMDENVRFMDSVAARYNDPVESFRVSSARAIVLMFIEEKSPKQINLAADVRREIIKAYRQSNSAELGKREFFDRALKELYHDLRQNPAFKQFVVQVFGGIGSGGIL